MDISSEFADGGRRLWERSELWKLPLGIGVVAIVGGGVVAAVSGPTGFADGSWLAAFLVLVGGVAQIGMSLAQAWLAEVPPHGGLVRSQIVTWNAGGALVVVGTLRDFPLLATVGGLVFGAAVYLFLRETRRSRLGPRWLRNGYRGLATLVLVSVPVGIVLAWVRA